MNPSEKVLAGQAVYSRSVLSVYDWWVLGISNSFIWKCPSSLILALFNQHVSGNHLDVGVGTGYFLDRCQFPQTHPRLALMDLNANSLKAAADRINRYQPETYQQDILSPIVQPIQPFDSISINYLLHCLPGSLESKSVVFDYLSPLLKANGTIFGATILQGNAPRSFVAKRLMKIYNKKGIFSNTQDTLEVLEEILKKRYTQYDIQVKECVALFWAKN